MANIFLASDHHFGHAKILTFTRKDGSPERVFSSVQEMDEHIVAQHNSVVRPSDKVYFLGDVAMSTKATSLSILDRMHGEKILIKGNHDLAKLSIYMQFFKDVRACHQLSGFLLSHVPIHPESLSRWKANVHGHTHSNRVMLGEAADPRYICVCMEQLDNYTPVSLEEINKRF